MLEQRKLEKLFRQNYSKMIHLASVLLGDGGEAEDVVQDIFLKLADSDILPPKRQLSADCRQKCLSEQNPSDATAPKGKEPAAR